MDIFALQKTTLVDFPGKIACVVFLPGCNLRCRFCHNPEAVLPEELHKSSEDRLPEVTFLNFLQTRQGLLDGVVICGGEPTIHPKLPNFIRKIKAKGFLVKLDTNGQNADMLQDLIDEQLLDYVAIDIKHLPSQVSKLMQNQLPQNFHDHFERSLALLQHSTIPYEYRTTIIKNYHTQSDIEAIAHHLKGVSKRVLQPFRKGKMIDSCFDGEAYTSEEIHQLCQKAQNILPQTEVRI